MQFFFAMDFYSLFYSMIIIRKLMFHCKDIRLALAVVVIQDFSTTVVPMGLLMNLIRDDSQPPTISAGELDYS